MLQHLHLSKGGLQNCLITAENYFLLIIISLSLIIAVQLLQSYFAPCQKTDSLCIECTPFIIQSSLPSAPTLTLLEKSVCKL